MSGDRMQPSRYDIEFEKQAERFFKVHREMLGALEDVEQALPNGQWSFMSRVRGAIARAKEG